MLHHQAQKAWEYCRALARTIALSPPGEFPGRIFCEAPLSFTNW